MRFTLPLRLAALALAGAASFAAPAGSPAPQAGAQVEAQLAEWKDAKRARVVPVKILTPAGEGEPLPVILFSHGLGGTREGGAAWGRHWAAHGFIVVHLQHPGSDESLWADRRGQPAEAFKALKSGATLAQFRARIEDVKFALDEMARRKAEGDRTMRRADLSRVGMSGHSFGSQTTLALAGQRFVRASGAEPLLLEPRVKAALALSPSSRSRARPLEWQFGSIRIPVLCITGTRDGDLIGDGMTPEARAKPFEHMPPPGKYLAVFEGGDHRVFGGQEMRGTATGRNARIQDDVKALSLAFWNAHLKRDASARAWLDGSGARSLLQPGDRFDAKP